MYTFTFRTFLLLLGTVCFSLPVHSQCVVDSLVPSIPGIYPDTLADAVGCEYYEQDVTFFLPQDTTVLVFGQNLTLPFNSFTIDSVTGLPAGLTWSCNLAPTCFYNVGDTSMTLDTLGCIQVFGTPSQVGIFPVVVHLTANVDLLGTPTDQPATYESSLIVSPCPFVGACYTFSLDNLCEGATISLGNNIPSNGDPAYTYDWSITGPGGFSYLTSDENPSPQVLPAAGSYVLAYDAVIDTFDYTLLSVSIDSVDCDDLLSAGDIYWILRDPTGMELVNTSANPINNGGANLPISTGIGPLTLIDTGSYVLEVWDDDPIINDAGCTNNSTGSGAAITFSVATLMGGIQTISQGGLVLTLDVAHPVQTLSCMDTIVIDTLPPMPEIMVMADTTVLCNEDSLVLMIMSSDSIQWFVDGQPVPNGTSEALVIYDIGTYTVQTLNPTTLCMATSAPVSISAQSIATPQIQFDGNLALGVTNPSPNLQYDWYDVGQGFLASGDSLQPSGSGNFYVVATDPQTGCSAVPSDTVQAVLASLDQLRGTVGAFRVYPNPSQGTFQLELALLQAQSVSVQIMDLSGRLIWTQVYGQQVGQFQQGITLPPHSSGIYLLRIQLDAGTLHQKLVLR